MQFGAVLLEPRIRITEFGVRVARPRIACRIIYARLYSSTARYVMAESLINLEIENLAEGGYLATSSDMPGLVAQGRTIAECVEIAQDVARKLIESYLEHGDPLPAKLTAAN